MEFKFAEKVNILGTDYAIEVKKTREDGFIGNHAMAYGFMDHARKRIVIRDRTNDPGFKDAPSESLKFWMKKTLRHEIVHAFLVESGLNEEARTNHPWPRNEEMVDWIAYQGPKLLKAWKDAKAL